MQITKENIDALNAVVKIQVEPADYQNRVNDVIKKYQRTANIPGFRPGKTPAGVIKKMYGKTVLVEELNKLLSESLGKYIVDNKLDVLGSPLPKHTNQEDSWEDGKSFEFLYELGFAPEFEVSVSSLKKTPYYLLKVDDTMIENDVNDMRRRYGKFSNPEETADNHILYGEFQEMENGEVKTDGNKTTTTLSLEMIRDDEKRKPFIGLKKDQSITFNPMTTLGNETEVAAMLRVEKSSPALTADYHFTVKTINQIEKADLNQEFFDKIYGKDVVKTEEEFRSKVKEGIASYFERQSDSKLKKDLRNQLLETVNLPLPDDFLKRMLKANQEKPVSDNEFDHQYYHASEDLRWSLIQNKLALANNVTIAQEDIRSAAKQMMQQQFYQYGMYDFDEAKLNDITDRYLNEGNNFERTERALLDQKVFEAIKTQVKLDMHELPYGEYTVKLSEKTAHELEHHH
jgi:trigger factor